MKAQANSATVFEKDVWLWKWWMRQTDRFDVSIALNYIWTDLLAECLPSAIEIKFEEFEFQSILYTPTKQHMYTLKETVIAILGDYYWFVKQYLGCQVSRLIMNSNNNNISFLKNRFHSKTLFNQGSSGHFELAKDFLENKTIFTFCLIKY